MNVVKSFDIEAARKSAKSFDMNKARYSAKSFDIEKARSGEVETPKSQERGIMDRVFGTLYYNGIIEGMYNMVDDDENSTFFSGLKEGFKYMNPLENDVSGRHTFSDVLEASGWEDKPDGKLNIGRGVAGFVGDVLLDPVTYLNPFSAIGKVIKGSGVGVDVVKGLNDISKVDEISNEVGKVLGGVDKSNISKIKALDYATARRIILDGPVGKNAVDESAIDKAAQELQKSFNEKILKLRQGGDDFTIGIGNLPFANKIKIGDKTLESFKKTIMSSNDLRKLGDKTIAPYYNSLAKKLRTSRLGKAFNTNYDISKQSLTNVGKAAEMFHAKELLSGIKRLGIDMEVVKTGAYIKNFFDGLDESAQADFVYSIDEGRFKEAFEFLKKIESFRKKYGVDYEDELKSLDALLEGVEAFKQSSSYNNIINRRNKLRAEGYDELPPVKEDFANEEQFKAAKDLWDKEHPEKNGKLFDVDIDVDEMFSDLSKSSRESVKKILASVDAMQKKYPTKQFHGNQNIVASQNTFEFYDDAEDIPAAFFRDLNYMGINPNAEALNYPTEYNKYLNIVKDMINRKIVRENTSGVTSDITGKSIFNPELVGVHEYGHAIQTALIKNGLWDDFKSFYKFLSPDEIKEFVTEYATDKPGELFAEGFADLIIGNKTHISEVVGNYITDATGYVVEPWEGLKLLDDDARLKRLKGQFRTASKNQFGEKHEWFEDINKLFGIDAEKKLAIDEMRNLKKAYDEMVGKFGEEGMSVARTFIEKMSKAADDEVARGLLKKEQADALKGRYVLHMTKLDKEAMQELIEADKNGAFNNEILGVLRKYNQSRIDGNVTLRQINANRAKKGEELLETNLYELYMTRALGSNKLIYGHDVQQYINKNFTKEFKDKLLDGYSVVASHKNITAAIRKFAMEHEVRDSNGKPVGNKEKFLTDEFIKLGKKGTGVTFAPNIPMQELTDEQIRFLRRIGLEPVQMRTDLLGLTNQMSRRQKQLLSSDMTNLYDRMLNIWKLQNTIINPGFHLQNAVSNAFQSFLGIGADALNPKKIKRAYTIFTNPDPKQKLVLNGVEYTYKELNQMATKLGVVDEMFHTFEFSRYGEGGMLSKLLPPGIDPTDPESFFLYKGATKVGTTIEGTQRMNIFLSALNSGKTPEEARDVVNKFLFDYSELTDVEQNIFKRIIPFYTFMRKNVPMELEQMLEQPTTFTILQKAMNNIEKMNENYVDENQRNEWRQEYMQFPVGQYGISDQLPYNQIERTFDLNKLLGQTSPLIKIPLEVGAQKYIYTDMPIESGMEYAANQIFPTKLIAQTMKKESPVDKLLYLTGQLSGFPVNKVENINNY